jgi:hypothetical protein
MTIYVDPALSGDDLRAELYAGQLVVLTQLPAVAELVAFARSELETVLAPDPEAAHLHHTPEHVAGLLADWKPRFIHSAEANRLVQAIIDQAGFEADHTYYDVPKPRTSFPLGHLNTGVAFAFPWHRDVWYSAPSQQINWWLPVFAARPDNAMSFDPRAFGREVANDSSSFDYYVHNAGRKDTGKQIKREVQARPKALDHEVDHETIVLPSPGSILLFSGAQLHTSIPNTSDRSRFSVDFRTVDDRDLVAGRGAPVVDAHCLGTSIRDFHSVVDGHAFDEELVCQLFGPPPAGAMLTFEPEKVG